MGKKKKGARGTIKLESTGTMSDGTRSKSVFWTVKNLRNAGKNVGKGAKKGFKKGSEVGEGRLSLRKYDPRLNKHVIFKEKKR